MELAEYLIAFYSIVVGLTATVYLQGWGDLIKDRLINRNYLVTIIWSLNFFMAIINEWIIQFNQWEERTSILDLLITLIFPFGIYIVGVLIFPSEQGTDSKENYFQHFLNQKKVIFIILIGLLILKLKVWDFDLTVHTRTRIEVTILLAPHIIALISNKKLSLLVCGFFVILFWIARILLTTA